MASSAFALTVALIALISFTVSSASAVRIPPGVLELDQVNFHKLINSSHTLIVAFNGPRKNVPSGALELAALFSTSKDVLVAMLDCTRFMKLCASYSLKIVPRWFVFLPGKEVPKRFERAKGTSLQRFVYRLVDPKAENLYVLAWQFRTSGDNMARKRSVVSNVMTLLEELQPSTAILADAFREVSMKALQGIDTLQAEFNATLEAMESGMVSPAQRARLSIKLDVLQMFSPEKLGSLPLTDEQIIADPELNFATKQLLPPDHNEDDGVSSALDEAQPHLAIDPSNTAPASPEATSSEHHTTSTAPPTALDDVSDSDVI